MRKHPDYSLDIYADYLLEVTKHGKPVDSMELAEVLDTLSDHIRFHMDSTAHEFYGIVDEVRDVKWYSDDSDMRMLSERFPGTVFRLHGEGGGMR